MKPRALLLYSGGFDSTVLLYDLCKSGYEVKTMHFDYGQRNFDLERRAVSHFTKKLNIEHFNMVIPRIGWSRSAINGGEAGEYVELRNLIFLAYALSYAESQGILEVYAGFIGLEYYSDTSPQFLKAMDTVAFVAAGLEVKAPYVFWGKDEVLNHARYEIGADVRDILEHTISCNLPVSGQRCGKCPDCQAITKYISEL